MSSAGQDNLAGAASRDVSPGVTHDGPAPQASRRVVVVGDALAEQLRDGLAEQCLPGVEVRAVPAFLSALGELGRDEAAAVVVPIAAMAGMVAAGAKTLRRMAPGSRLLVVADDASLAEAQRAVEHGFDALVPEPVDLDTLHLAWHGRPVPPPQVDTDATTPLADRPAMPAARNGATAAIPGQSEDHELGDVDLVEAILNGRGLLRRTAMRLLTARSGIDDVQWAGPDDDVPTHRITATVACRQHLFGTLHAPALAEQQHLDAWAAWLARWLTLERQIHQLEELSMKDELTCIWNRRYFNRFLKNLIERSVRDRSQVTLMVFDIDDFKIYNDRYGHAAGDEILRETARLMQSSVREHDVVARIGGDEFAVIFWDAEEKRRADSQHPESVRTAAKRFQQAVQQHRFPKLLNEAPGTLTISGGLASFPWDGRTPQELLERADEMAMQSKRQGKNAITFGPGALRQGDA
ncbi:MAG: GGDEF domain-containing protein [Phycisphaeraceae bacterium]